MTPETKKVLTVTDFLKIESFTCSQNFLTSAMGAREALAFVKAAAPDIFDHFCDVLLGQFTICLPCFSTVLLEPFSSVLASRAIICPEHSASLMFLRTVVRFFVTFGSTTENNFYHSSSLDHLLFIFCFCSFV